MPIIEGKGVTRIRDKEIATNKTVIKVYLGDKAHAGS